MYRKHLNFYIVLLLAFIPYSCVQNQDPLKQDPLKDINFGQDSLSYVQKIISEIDDSWTLKKYPKYIYDNYDNKIISSISILLVSDSSYLGREMRFYAPNSFSELKLQWEGYSQNYKKYPFSGPLPSSVIDSLWDLYHKWYGTPDFLYKRIDTIYVTNGQVQEKDIFWGYTPKISSTVSSKGLLDFSYDTFKQYATSKIDTIIIDSINTIRKAFWNTENYQVSFTYPNKCRYLADTTELYCENAEIEYKMKNYGEVRMEVTSQTVEDYQKMAEQGEAKAQFYLGVHYYNGDGVDINKTEAVKWFRKAAEQGIAGAQCNLGNCYYTGEGVGMNKAEAVKWYRKAAEQGIANAQCNLGVCYDYGEGVSINKSEAVKWYRKAAEQGIANAQYHLGNCYNNGIGVIMNKSEAAKWFHRAAKQGDVYAQYNLGLCYDNGNGVSINKVEAVKWYRKAAEQGSANAQYNLGNCYNNGEGVDMNKVEAAKWFHRAAKQEHAEAQYNLGVCYYNGDGVVENKAEAIKWFRMAVKQGCTKAQCILNTIDK